MFALMYDLQLMAESNATDKRALHLRNDVLIAAQAIYKVATFQLIGFKIFNLAFPI